MPKLTLDLDADLYRLLQQAAQQNQISLEEECLHRLEGGVRRSRYMHALLAVYGAGDEQRRAEESDGRALPAAVGFAETLGGHWAVAFVFAEFITQRRAAGQ